MIKLGDQLKNADLDYKFAQLFTHSGGFFNYCADEAEALQTLNKILKIEDIKSVFCCDKDLKKMRKVREELNKRIDNLADEENKVLRQHRITVERALVYSLGRKTVQMQKGLYYALLEIQPNASFCYKSDIKKLKEKYKIVEDSDESSKEIQAK